jgi:hypothetical protein
MRTLFTYIEIAMAASAFAEEGEFETARAMMQKKQLRKQNRIEAYDDKRPVARKEIRAD